MSEFAQAKVSEGELVDAAKSKARRLKKLIASIGLGAILSTGLTAMPALAADTGAPAGINQDTVREVVYNLPLDLDY